MSSWEIEQLADSFNIRIDPIFEAIRSTCGKKQKIHLDNAWTFEATAKWLKSYDQSKIFSISNKVEIAIQSLAEHFGGVDNMKELLKY